MDLWDLYLQANSDTEMKGRLQGVKAAISTFQFLFSCSLGKRILKQADNLSKTLQNPWISAAQGHWTFHLVTETMWKERCHEKFELFWSDLKNKKIELDIADPKLPLKESYLILIVSKVQMTVFTMINQKYFIVSCISKPLIKS